MLNFFKWNKDKQFKSEKDSINVDYIDSFIPIKRAQLYFNVLEKNLKFNSDEESTVVVRGKRFKIPRKQVAYGDKGTYYRFSGNNVNAICWIKDGKPCDKVCRVLLKIKKLVEDHTGHKYNFVLINRYNDGNDCIGFHKDDEKQLGDTPNISCISLGQARDFQLKAHNFKPQETEDRITVNLSAGSLLVMNHPTNEKWKHSVPRRARVNRPRISLTFRKMHI